MLHYYSRDENSQHVFLQLLLENTQEIFVLIDTDFKVVLFNKAAYDITIQSTGKQFETGVPVLNYTTEEQKEEITQIFRDVLAGKDRNLKYHPAHNITVYVTFSPVYTNHKVEYILITALNITSEENARIQVSINQQLMERAEQIAGLGSWEWDIPSNKILWSAELYRMLGYQPGEVTPSKELGFKFIHPDDLSKALSTLTESFKSGKPYSTEIRIILNESNIKFIYCQGIVIRNAQGRNEKIVGTFLDITSKKVLEETLQKQQQRFQSLVENSADVILQINAERIITYASPAVTAMMQYAPEEMVGQRLKTFAYPSDMPDMMNEFFIMMNNPGVPRTTEYRIVKKDGSFFWAEGTITNLLHIPGVNSIVLNQRDISQRKEAEKLLNQLNETLASSNVELERFAYVASHDLQEPLRMVSSFLQLLQSKYLGQLDEKAQQYIYYAVDGAERMKRLISDLLEYSRAGSKRIIKTGVDMNELISHITLIFKEQLDETSGTLIADVLPEIVADRIQMVQLFQNLIGNAIKYRSNENPVIKIKGDETENDWRFSVEDNGIGVPTEYADEIFNIFQRLHGKNEYEGTGIGLAICKKIVDTHGGKIWMTPAEETGSIFHFTIKKQSVS